MFDKPRRARRVLMHISDAGHVLGEEAVRFECRMCGHETAWLVVTRTEGRGLPCPKCNGDNSGASQ